MGSGHILVYIFDVLMQIYEACGYSARDAVRSIVENNLYGLDIDDRAAQLSYFAVMMKARSYDRRFFSRSCKPKVYAIRESNDIDRSALEYLVSGDEALKKAMDSIIEDMHDAKEYGSIITVRKVDFEAIYERFDELFDDISIYREYCLNELLPLVQVAEVLAMQYHAVVTNPPYMGGSGMSTKLNDFVKKNYPDSKSDLFAVFIEKCAHMTAENGYQAMITQHAWMFLSSYEKLRVKLLSKDIVNMAHLGARAFEEIGGEVVQTTSFVLKNCHIQNFKGTYCRLIEPTTQHSKEDMFLASENRYASKQSNFSKISGSPVAYWFSDTMFHIFESSKTLADVAKPRQGLATSDNNRFLKLWHEVDFNKIGFNITSIDDENKLNFKWFPCTKGGSFRRWYGNNEYVVNWENNGFEIKEFAAKLYKSYTRTIKNIPFYFRKGLTWSTISSSLFSLRYVPEGFIFETKGAMCFVDDDNIYSVLALYNTKVVQAFLRVISPTLDYHEGSLGRTPVMMSHDTRVIGLSHHCVALSKSDWDSFETSWDFQYHPLLPVYADDSDYAYSLEDLYHAWEAQCNKRFAQLKANEEELNRIFIDIYGLQDELTPDVEDRDVTVRKADLQRDVKSLISFAVGCMLGRYSLGRAGLAYAGGEWDASKYPLFPADKDNVIPICDDDYFDDDIVGRFVKFIELAYGKASLDENLSFIANALGGKGKPKDVIRNYFLNDFYADHCRLYQKRPIYWLFDAGKKGSFKALIYMHRYQPDSIARIRTDYVHEQQGRYRTAIADLESRIANADTGNRVKLTKQLSKLQEQAEELRSYEEKIHHLADKMLRIDLDDGVKHNYELFKDVLARIK